MKRSRRRPLPRRVQKSTAHEHSRRLDIRLAAALFMTAFAVRAIYIWQIRLSPFVEVLLGDARRYDLWARQIAGGDWLGHGVFYQAPLYPYFLGALYASGGRNLLVVRVVQALIGSASCLLLALAGRRFFSDRVGLIAGFGQALYAPAIFFDGLLQKSVLDVFFVCFSLWLIAGLMDNPDRPSAWLALGLDLGSLALTRENSLILAGAVACWALARSTRPVARRATSVAWFVLGLSIVLLPVALRNRMVGGEWQLTTAQAGPNFYIGNNARASGVPSSLREGRGAAEFEREDAVDLAEAALGRPLTSTEVSRYWTAQAFAFIRSQPAAWLRLVARKTALLVNRTEWIDTESQQSYEEWSPMLRTGAWVGHFGVLVPLALVGVIATWRARDRLWVLYLMAGAYAASVVMFYVSARYRFPLVPFLMLFAAAGLLSLRGLFHGRTPAHLTAVVAAAGSVAIVANWPMLRPDLMRAITENNLGAALQEDRRLEEAAVHYQRAVLIQQDYAPAYNNLGVVLLALNRPKDAIAAYERAAALMPAYSDPEYNLANALLRAGKAADAIDHFKKALTLAPGSADAYNNLGIALASAHRSGEAIQAFEAALRFDAGSFQAHRNLGEVLLDQRRPAEAIGEFRAAIQRMPGSWEAHNGLGMALGSAGRLEEAIAEFNEAVRLDPDADDARRNLDLARQAMQAAARRSRAVAP